ncbi:MAG: bifunctional riboflavin kinase/FAD synthetase [Gorillibacterium sp.]|nr:bifunctional riboflavin kinase/FAD synthetase [Gorillibacterium sp.]
MQVIELKQPFDFSARDLPSSQVLAIGDFDGVHLGHQEVIERALKRAKQLKLPASIMTFHPHPREVLGTDKYRQILTPLPDKLKLFSEMGIEYTYLVSFDKEFSSLSPEEFVTEMLFKLKIESVIVGFDFTFGRNGSGTADSLATLSAGQFAVEVVRPYCFDGSKVSSTLIRECLQDGRLAEANALLGRSYAIGGIIVEGEGRGRTIGYPTANVELALPYVVPVNGVYAVRVRLGNQTLGGVMNIGVKPTFTGEGIRTLEVHLFDFTDSIYGESIHIQFVDPLRAEQKFNSVNELIAQIAADADEARTLLGGKVNE